MKITGLFLAMIIGVAASGCATVNHTENFDVDQYGATGSYYHHSFGPSYKMAFAAGGGGSGTGVGSGAGAGGLGFMIDNTHPQSDPRYFAKSVVMLDLSKKLTKVTVDDVTGIREYEYAQPAARGGYKSSAARSAPPSAYGYKPVE